MIQWLSNSLRTAIEDSVSKYKGRVWRIRTGKDLAEFACHPCAPKQNLGYGFEYESNFTWQVKQHL